jgi:hypothetical protein
MKKNNTDIALDVATWIIAFSPIALFILWVISESL